MGEKSGLKKVKDDISIVGTIDGLIKGVGKIADNISDGIDSFNELIEVIVDVTKVFGSTVTVGAFAIKHPFVALGVATTGGTLYLGEKATENRHWQEEAAEKAQPYIDQIVNAQKTVQEEKETMVKEVKRNIADFKKISGYFKELQSYLDENGNIISNSERSIELYNYIQSAIPDRIQMQNNKITWDNTAEQAIQDNIIFQTANVVVDKDGENYQQALSDWKSATQQKFKVQNEVEQYLKQEDLIRKELSSLLQKAKDVGEGLGDDSPNYLSRKESDRIQELKDQLQEVRSSRITAETKLAGYNEHIVKLEDYINSYIGVKDSLISDNVDQITNALKKYDPSLLEDYKINKQLIMALIYNASTTMSTLQEVLKEADERGVGGETFKQDMITEAMATQQKLAQIFLQSGAAKEDVSNMLAEFIAQISQIAPEYEDMAKAFFGEQAAAAYEKMQSVTKNANEVLAALQAEAAKVLNKSADQAIKDFMEQGMSEEEAEEALLKSVELMNTAKAKVTDGMNEVANKVAKAQADAEAAGIKIKADVIKQANDAVAEARKIAESGIEQIKEDLGINSPSKVAAKEIGFPLAQGVGVGFEKGIKAFGRKASSEMLDSLNTNTVAFSSQQMKRINAMDEKELINMVETARSTVRASMQDPFGGSRPEIIGGYAYGFGGNTTSYSNTYNFHSPKALDYREMRQEMRRMDQLNRLMALG